MAVVLPSRLDMPSGMRSRRVPRSATSLTRRWSLGGRLLQRLIVTVGVAVTITGNVEVTVGATVTDTVAVELTVEVTGLLLE